MKTNFIRAINLYNCMKCRDSFKQFWDFIYVHIVLLTIFMATDIVLLHYFENHIGLISAIYFIAMLLPLISSMVRRLHDTNRSGLWLFLLLVPVAGWILLLVFFLEPGDDDYNEYGKPQHNKYFS